MLKGKLCIDLQTLYMLRKLYIDRQTWHLSSKLCISRKELIGKESGNERKYFKMAEGEGGERDVIEHYFHLGYTNEIILEWFIRLDRELSLAVITIGASG